MLRKCPLSLSSCCRAAVKMKQDRCSSSSGFSKWCFPHSATARAPGAPGAGLLPADVADSVSPAPGLAPRASFHAAGRTLAPCRWASPALPCVYLGLFGALPGDQSGLMGTRLLWGWFRPELQPGIKKELCCVPGAFQKLQPYLVWKLLCLEEKWSE